MDSATATAVERDMVGRFRDTEKEAAFLQFYMTTSLATPAAASVIGGCTFIALPLVVDGFVNRISLPDSVAAVFLSVTLWMLGLIIFVQLRRRRWGSPAAVERVNLIVCTLVSVAAATASFLWNCMPIKRVGVVDRPSVGSGTARRPTRQLFFVHFLFSFSIFGSFGRHFQRWERSSVLA